MNRLRLRFFATGLAALLAVAYGAAQRTEIYDKNIHTVSVQVNGRTADPLPVMRLGTDDVLRLSFDELSHDYHRYTYRIEHLDADFKKEDGLFESDYVQATADEGIIEESAQSMNTSVLYTHYTLDLPNDYMRPLLSGNYALTVRGEDGHGDPQPVLRVFFYVTEEAANVMAEATTNTDIDWNAAHQQFDVTVQWRNDLVLRDPDTEIRLVVLQNGRWDRAVTAPPATGHTASALKWEHVRALIFDAGNEYRKFEIQSTRYPGLHADAVRYYDPYYHVVLLPDAPRRNYLYDEDQNGRYVPSVADNADPDTGADYVWVHFRIDMPQLADGRRLYVNGRWTYDRLTPEYELAYDAAAGAYEAALFLKQGYYAYQYILSSPPQSVEGNYWQTENEYTFLVYYRQAGARYDRLIAYRTASFRPQ